MKPFIFKVFVISLLFGVTGCTSLSRQEEIQLQQLKGYGITVNRPVGNWESPASPTAAGALNILPGIGNFYLASGNGAEGDHFLYGCLNLITWPLSILWGVPEGIIDAQTINEREMLHFYLYTPQGQYELYRRGIYLR